MVLNQSQKAKIQEKIKEALSRKGRGSWECSVCSHNAFTISDGYVNFPASDNPGQIVFGGKSLPNAILVCDNCGNTYFFNLVVWGIIKDNEK